MYQFLHGFRSNEYKYQIIIPRRTNSILVYIRMSFGSISVLSPVGRLVNVMCEMCEILQKTENMDGVTRGGGAVCSTDTWGERLQPTVVILLS